MARPELRKTVIEYDGNKRVELTPGKKEFFDEFYSDFQYTDVGGQKRFSLTINPKRPIVLKRVYCVYGVDYEAKDLLFCHGLQSWTESRERSINDRIKPLRWIAEWISKYAGDYTFLKYPNKAGHLHSWNYTYIRRTLGEKLEFIGSVNENNGYTLFMHDTKAKTLTIDKDCAGLHLEHSWSALELFEVSGDEKNVFDPYFQEYYKLSPAQCNMPQTPALGWTSWYNYYTNINEKVMSDNLAACAEMHKELPQNDQDHFPFLFQVDDGWATKCGDWLSVKKDAFPNGMDSLAKSIHAKGFTAGLWLAPLIAEKDSELFQKHPDWFLKDEKGKPISVGYNPGWSGKFYALDFYNREVQDYLAGVFHVVFHRWGYDLVKLDFLFAAAVKPRPDRTRGQIMSDVMDFLRRQAGPNKQILGCGVPIVSAWGKVEYCRIGADVHLKWEHGLLKFFRHRERVSSRLSLQNALSRYHQHKRAFYNDTDVFILRKENNKLTEGQRQLLFQAYSVLGGIVLTSDNMSSWPGETKSQYAQIRRVMCNAQQVRPRIFGDEKFKMKYVFEGKTYTYEGNLLDGTWKLTN